jgi:flagellar motor protein MotB
MAYSNEELTAIANAAMMTGMVVAMADMGIISSAIEAAAMTKEIMGAAAKYPNNSIVQAAFSEAAIRSGTVKMNKPDIQPADVASGAFVDKAIAAVNSVVAALEGKATAEEIKEYKTLIYSVGEAVANAAGSGLFGSGATKVSPEEAAALAKIKAALGI